MVEQKAGKDVYLHVEHDDWPGLEVKKSFLHLVHIVELK